MRFGHFWEGSSYIINVKIFQSYIYCIFTCYTLWCIIWSNHTTTKMGPPKFPKKHIRNCISCWAKYVWSILCSGILNKLDFTLGLLVDLRFGCLRAQPKLLVFIQHPYQVHLMLTLQFTYKLKVACQKGINVTTTHITIAKGWGEKNEVAWNSY